MEFRPISLMCFLSSNEHCDFITPRGRIQLPRDKLPNMVSFGRPADYEKNGETKPIYTSL